MVDIDSGMKLEDLIDHWFFQLYGAGFYTTASHTEENNRFRIIYVLEEAITDRHMMKELYEGLLTIHGAADTSCKDVCRLFYGVVNPTYAAISDKKLSAAGVELVISSRIPREVIQHEPLVVQESDATDLIKILDDLKSHYPVLPYHERFIVANTVGAYLNKNQAIMELRSRWPDAECNGKYEAMLKHQGKYSNTPRMGTLVHMIRCMQPNYRKKKEPTIPTTRWELKAYLEKALNMNKH
jgi:hypothetical protein